jgi:hypothetical protein
LSSSSSGTAMAEMTSSGAAPPKPAT